MLSLAEGALDTHVPATRREDEIGGIARAMAIFKQNASKSLALSRSVLPVTRTLKSPRVRLKLLLMWSMCSARVHHYLSQSTTQSRLAKRLV
jgi:hypothetical protein